MKEHQDRNLRQELHQRTWRNSAYWIAHGWLNLLSYISNDHLYSVDTASPPMSIINPENAHIDLPKANQREEFLSIESFFLDDLILFC